LFLFIFESFGTSELLLVGLVALILLGPRKLPELARRAGKMMSEFRGTANEFKETWQREVNFEEEAKALDLNAIEAETVKHGETTSDQIRTNELADPLVKPIDPAMFENFDPASKTKTEDQPQLPLEPADVNDKKNWL